MIDFTSEFAAELSAAHDLLNSTYAVYDGRSAGLSNEYLEIKMQMAIFNYEMSMEMAGFVRNNPSGFAQSVALRVWFTSYSNTINS